VGTATGSHSLVINQRATAVAALAAAAAAALDPSASMFVWTGVEGVSPPDIDRTKVVCRATVTSDGATNDDIDGNNGNDGNDAVRSAVDSNLCTTADAATAAAAKVESRNAVAAVAATVAPE
jgi:uncharacterized protein (DUF2147 family)